MTGARRNKRRIVVRAALAVLALLLLIGLGGGLWLRGRIRASLPRLEGEIALSGLTAAVTVERDAHGVPTVRGGDRADVARALGFVHAQDRFFQMDLLRRRAAGELAALVGSAVVEADRAMRVHRFRAVARANLEHAHPDERLLLEAYTAGVNAGLVSLRGVPPEYLATGTAPAPWLPEDSVLVVLAMYDNLQSDNPSRESARGVARDLLPRELFDFLVPAGTEWDAPLTGGAIAGPPIPGPDVFDLREEAPAEAAALGRLTRPRPRGESPRPGSNSWALAGSHSADGRAWIANDMHLGLGMPNIWYRVVLEWDARRVAGVSLPGSPWISAGSNGFVAWGYTNSQGDYADLVIVEELDDGRYRTPAGPRPFEIIAETIDVRDGDPVTLEIRSTIWGPVVDRDHRDRPRALRWVAHGAPLGPSLLHEMEHARTLDEAMLAANRSGIPTQNVLIADASGRIAWTLMGPVPRRRGCDGFVPHAWADEGCGWDGRLSPEEYPRIVDPPGGRLWTANNRILDGAGLERIGDGGYADGARAGQIRDALLALDRGTPRQLFDIGLDDRALFLERWRDLLLDVLTDDAVAGNPLRVEFRDLVRDDWTGRAAVDATGYRLVRGFRMFLADELLGALTARCTAADEDFSHHLLGQAEGPLWALVVERPAHLLPSGHASWDAQLQAAVDTTADYFVERHEDGLAARTWGELNTLRMQHPMSLAVPQLARWLDAPPVQLPGDSRMPRVQGATFGASERFVVSPGREAESLFHMPGGQSGHPFSPHYLAGHEAWVDGEPTPFLPGATATTLTLVPGS